MIENWFDVLGNFHFTIEHLPGKLNIVPDTLSRFPCDTHTVLLTNINETPPTPLQTDEPQSPPFNLEELHSYGHFQSEKMVRWLTERNFSWPNMEQDCQRVARACIACQQCNEAPLIFNPLHSIDAFRPFDHVQIDLVTDLPSNTLMYHHVLVVTDVASKFTLLRPLKAKSATAVAQSLFEIICTHGPMKIIQSDQGREFDNNLIKHLNSIFHVEQRLASAYSPRTNGLVERTNRTWTNILRKLCAFCQHRWPEFLPITQFFLNTRISKPTGSCGERVVVTSHPHGY